MSKIKETFLLNIVFPTADFVMRTKVIQWYRQLNKMEQWPAEKVKLWQLDNLKLLVNKAYNHTVYYRELFDKLGLKPEDIKTFDDLKRLPVLTKETVKERFNDIKPDNIDKIKHRYASTGGSTGEPLKYIVDENTWAFTTAVKIYSWQKAGYRYGDMFLSLGSSSLFPVNKKSLIHEIYYKLRNTIPINVMNMDDTVCEQCVSIIKKYNIKYIYGYTSAIYLLALYCKRKGIDIIVKGVFATSEKLTKEYRKLIEATWKVRVMDCYGARDSGVTAYEIHPGYFNVGYSTFCETEKSDEPLELLCTNLIDRAFPLIRYKIGDEVIIPSDEKMYNYNGQIFTEITGRTSDILQFDNGHSLTPTGFSIMFRNFNVKAFRIIKVDGHTIKIEIQKGVNYSQEEESLIFETMKKHVGQDIDIQINYVEGFQPLKNGKRSFFINEIE